MPVKVKTIKGMKVQPLVTDDLPLPRLDPRMKEKEALSDFKAMKAHLKLLQHQTSLSQKYD